MSKNRIKRAAAEAAGWIAALAVWLVVAAMECGVLRPVAGAALGLGLELVGALALYKAGVIRLPTSEERGDRIATASVRAGFAMAGDGREPLHRLRRSPSPEGEAMTEDDGRRRTDRW